MRSPFFEPSGERRGGSGEYVVVMRPNPPEPGPRTLPQATLDVYRRSTRRGWEKVSTLDIDQRHGQATAPGGTMLPGQANYPAYPAYQPSAQGSGARPIPGSN